MSKFGPMSGNDPMMEGLINPSNVNVVGRPPTILPPITPLPPRTPPPRTEHGTSIIWGILLIIACLALGLVASWAQFERTKFKNEQSRAAGLETADSVMEAQAEDLGRFLAEPHTQLIRLTRTDGSPAVEASLIWNPTKQLGYLLCDQLQALDHGTHYEIWTIGRSEEAQKMAGIDMRPGVSVYPFKSEIDVKGAGRVEITAGPRSSNNAAILVGPMQ